MAHDVTFIPGDGTGPELTEATRRVLEATGVGFNWDRHEAGIDEHRKHGNPLPDATLASLKCTEVGIKGPTTTPVGTGFRSINVLLRKELDLYACIRPCKALEGVRTRFPETDRGHRLGSLRGDDRRAGYGGRSEHRHGRRRVRGDAWLVADVRRQEPDEPDGAHAVGRVHARPPEESAAARALEHAIAAVIRTGDQVTYDLKPSRTDPTAVGTSQFADAVIEEMNA